MKQIITLVTMILAAGMVMAQPALKVDQNGNVGIGTADPTELLDVVGNTKIRGAFLLHGQNSGNGLANMLIGYERSDAGASGIRFYNSSGDFDSWATTFGVDGAGAGGLFHAGNGNLILSTTTAQSIILGVADSENFRVNSDGNIGIQQSSPAFALELGAGNAAKPGGGQWAAPSDRRLKRDIKKYTMGLEEVLKINPVRFKYNGSGGFKTGNKEFVGVIAQDFKKISPTSVFEIKRDIKEFKDAQIKNPLGKIETVIGQEEFLAVDPSDIPYMLVNAIKEQHDQITRLQQDNTELREMIAEVLNKIGSTSHEVILDDFGQQNSLGQNAPNPFNSETTIPYFIPESATTAKMVISNTAGQIIQEIDISTKGKGVLNIKRGTFDSGNYFYNLIIDGIKIGVKQMSIIN